MKELFDILFITLHFFEFLPVVIGFYYYKEIKNTYWKWFLYYLVFIFTVELMSGLSIILTDEMRRYYYGFLIIPIEFVFFYWLYAYKSLQYKKLFWLLCFVYLISFIPHYYLEREKTVVYSFNYVVGAFLLGILVFLEYLKQIRSDSIINFKHNRMFYINLGVSLLYVGTLPLFSFFAILAKDREIFVNYNIYFLLINHLMYLLFTMSFIWGKPNTY